MRFTVVMPAFNESEGIAETVREILAAFNIGSVTLIVVDDASRDSTSAEVELLASQGLPVIPMRNDDNLGHGPTTIRALTAGLETGADIIVAVDGDGQFSGFDVARVASLAKLDGTDVVEGVRVGRGDPMYRRFVSSATRSLVRSACGSTPRDANTPLRAYTRERLREILHELPKDAMTPNLLISASARRRAWSIREVEVASLDRRGSSRVGTTWGGSRIQIPSRRFVTFCWKSLRQWRTFQSERH